MPLRRLTLTSRPAVTRYATATAVFLAALLVRFIALPVEARAGFLTFYPAMVLVLYLCGTGPGLWVLLLSTLSGFYFFYPPYSSWVITPTSGLVALSYVVSSLVIAAVMRTLQNTNLRLGDALGRVALSDARWKAMVNDQSDIVARFDARGAVVLSNEIAQRLLGDAARPGVPHSWREAVHPEDLPKVLEQLATLSPAKPSVRFDCRVRDLQGSLHWVDFVDHAFYDASGQLLEIQSVGRDVSDRKLLEQNLRDAESELRDLYDNAPCGYYSLDIHGRFLRVNKVMEALLERPATELLHRCGPGDFTAPQSLPIFESNFASLRDGREHSSYELTLRSASGNERHVRVQASAIRDAQGAFLRTRSAMLDITELTKTRHALEAVVLEQNAMLNNDLVGIVKLQQRTAVWVNRAFARIFGYEREELIGTSSRIIYQDDASFEEVGREAYPALRKLGTHRAQAQLVKKSGEPVWVDMSGTMLSLERQESMWMMLDITDAKIHELQVETMAYQDALTGLPNRSLLLRLVERELTARKRLGNELAVCFIDLDDFKPINDKHGHEAGDAVLKVVGQRLQQCVRGTDIVARLGGDEFVVVLTHLGDLGGVARAVTDTLQRHLEQLRKAILLADGTEVRVSASIGVALAPGDAEDVRDLLRCADEAMYDAKGAGRNQIRFFGKIPEQPAGR